MAFSQKVGDEAPDFTLNTLGGSSFTLSDHRGSVVFIFLFGYACPHCLANGNNTETGIYNVYKGKEDFVAVGVDTWNGNESGVQSFKSSTGITYPLCLKGSSLESLYSSTYDRILVIDKEGILRYKSTSNSVQSVVSDASDAIEAVFDGTMDTTTTDTSGNNMNTGVYPQEDRSGLKIYPVPASDQLTIESTAINLDHATVTIMNSAGKVLFDRSVSHFSDGSSLVRVSVNNLATGIYFVRINAEEKTVTRKFAVIENR